MPEPLKFRISSELKNIIGKELITDDFIAIFELVKNCYDAASRKVDIIFKHIQDNEYSDISKLFIIDRGNGMSKIDIDEKWLLVGHSWKSEQDKELEVRDFRDKMGKRRIFAGAKGIGRFSCDRLGNKLTLYTKKEDENIIHKLDIDWDKFEEDPNKEFQMIDVIYGTIKKLEIEVEVKDFKKGTILEISSLRSKWDREKLLKLKRHLQRLINPAELGGQEFQIYLNVEEELNEDKNKKEDYDKVNGIIRNIVFEKLGINTTKINCRIDEYGRSIHTELIDKGTFIYKLEEKNEYPFLKNINIMLFYLNPVAKGTFTKIMGIEPVRYGSVFFYKNGIKINPYGNEGDDWLGLDRRKAQGTRRFLGNRDVMGRLEVYGSQRDFREVSSRDGGVIKTSALDQLTDPHKGFFYSKALVRLEKYVIEGIAWDSEKRPKDPDEIKADSFKIITQLAGSTKDKNIQIEFNENLLDIYSRKQIEKTPDIIKNIESIKNQIESKETRAYLDLQVKTVRDVFRNLRKTQRELERELKIREEQALFLESTTDEDRKDILALQHQIGIGGENINKYLLNLKKKIEKGITISNAELLDVIGNIILQVQVMSSFARAPFVTKARFDLIKNKIKGNLALFIKQYVERVYLPFNKFELDQKQLNIKIDCDPNAVFKTTFSPSDFIVIIDNLLSNSQKAKASHINITINVLNEKTLEIKVKDDGIGIKDEYLDKIFNFGFSTITGGSGIGLYHVNNIIKKYGSIIVNNNLDKGVEFILEVKR
jgi:signal transduction histidine kinase